MSARSTDRAEKKGSVAKRIVQSSAKRDAKTTEVVTPSYRVCHELLESREMIQTRLDPYSMRRERNPTSTFQNTVVEYFGTNQKKQFVYQTKEGFGPLPNRVEVRCPHGSGYG